MKKILFALVTAVALMCSVTNKASAAEENGEEPIETSDVYGGNLFTGFEINLHDYVSGDNPFNDEDKYFTNLVPVKADRELLLSIKINPSGENINKNKQVFFSGRAVLFDENFRIVNSIMYHELYDMPESYKVEDAGEYFTYNKLFRNLQNEGNGSEVKYMSIGFYNIRYTDLSGNTVYSTTENVESVYIGNVLANTINQEDMKTLEFNYEANNPQITWNCIISDVDKKYLQLDVSDDVLTDVNALFSAVDANGDKLIISSGDINGYVIPEVGGEYNYIFEARDTTGNRDFLYVKFNVIDDVAPLISGPTTLKVPNKIKTPISSIKNALIIVDDHDAMEDVKLFVKYDYYSDNYNIPGEYYICFTAQDKAGNTTDFTIAMIVEDKDAPVIYDENGMVRTKDTTVIKSIDSVLLISDFINQLKAVDNVDGELKLTIHKDEYTGNGDKEGSYIVVLRAKDTSGNVVYHNVRITVSASMPSKTIFVDNKIVIVEKKVKLNQTAFHTILKLSGKYNIETTSYTKIHDYIYSPSYNVEGEYLVPYEITTISGIEESDTLIVRVVDSRTNGSLVDHPEQVKEDGVIVSILKWIWNLLVSLYNWFIGLFK